ncbi:hypothetical protein MRX96_025988 [Rhipicephalus microplus]
MERFRFNNQSRRDGETLGTFVAALRGLASSCTFGEQLHSLLRDRFVCGINDPAMETGLLGVWKDWAHCLGVPRGNDGRTKAAVVEQVSRASPRPSESTQGEVAGTCGSSFRCHG